MHKECKCGNFGMVSVVEHTEFLIQCSMFATEFLRSFVGFHNNYIPSLYDVNHLSALGSTANRLVIEAMNGKMKYKGFSSTLHSLVTSSAGLASSTLVLFAAVFSKF